MTESTFVNERRASSAAVYNRRPLTPAQLVTPKVVHGETQCLQASYVRSGSLPASLTLGGTGFQLVLRRCWPVGIAGEIALVLVLPDQVTVQCDAVVLRCGPHRMLVEARDVDTARLAAIKRHC